MLDRPQTDAMNEARRAAQICNACRYCESYCPVFPALFQRRDFPATDLAHLANLCHNCKGCWHACQYAPPHEFGLNLPAMLARVRTETYAEYAFPRSAGRLFQRNGLVVSMVTALALAAVMLGAALLIDPATMTARHTGEGAFYAVIPHNTMIWLGGLSFGWAILATIIGVAKYWRAAGGGRPGLGAIRAALADAATTRHLGSGGGGCNDIDTGFFAGPSPCPPGDDVGLPALLRVHVGCKPSWTMRWAGRHPIAGIRCLSSWERWAVSA